MQTFLTRISLKISGHHLIHTFGKDLSGYFYYFMDDGDDVDGVHVEENYKKDSVSKSDLHFDQ